MLEYSVSDSMTSGSLRNYHRDEVNVDADEIAANYRTISNKITKSRSFEYKTKILRRESINNKILNAEVAVPFKYLSNFCGSLDLVLINCEIELNLSWSKACVISEISRTPKVRANTTANPPTDRAPPIKTTGDTFQVTSAKLYVPVVTLSINDNIKFLEDIKQGFRRTVSRNKYTSEIMTQPKHSHLDYMIDPTFRNINKLFVLSFENGDNNATRDSYSLYDMILVKVKDFNALIDNKPFFD